MNKDLDRIVLNLTGERGEALPVTVAARPDGRVAIIVSEESDVQINLYPRQWRAVLQAIRWIARGDAPWPDPHE